jgi:hypothetical protein
METLINILEWFSVTTCTLAFIIGAILCLGLVIEMVCDDYNGPASTTLDFLFDLPYSWRIYKNNKAYRWRKILNKTNVDWEYRDYGPSIRL